ncbi:MAG TPA: hypothetical protein GX711_07185, partial [Clostridia bacterium]|nr:hypothetical protein [Clostridia bacterium]
MAKLRVYEVAREKKMNSKDMIHILGRLGIEVKSHMSVLTESQVRKVDEFFAPRVSGQGEETPKKTGDGPARDVSAGGKAPAKKKQPKKGGLLEKPITASKGTAGKKGKGMFQGPKPEGTREDPEAPKKQPIKKKTSTGRKEGDPRSKKGRPYKKSSRQDRQASPPVVHIKKITVGNTIV